MIATEIVNKAELWLKEPFDIETQEAVKLLIDSNQETLTEAFHTNLSFGTGGMRGIMGVGTNRINKYTLGQATQGLANYLKSQFNDQEQIKVVIGHDCRHNSRPFAQTVANVLSANGIQVYLFEDLRPTPEVSFAIRHLDCHSGIILTASHNPKEYNGYKVYWNDGAQLVPPYDTGVMDAVANVAFDDIQFNGNDALISIIGEEIDEAFTSASANHSFQDAGKKDLKIVFTSLHGTSINGMPQTLEKAGFSHVHIVEEQAIPDGNFPTVESPNPEEPAALKMAIDKANEIEADIVIGTDPDADRIGVAVRDLDGEMTLLNGNQTAALLTWYLLDQHKQQGKLSGNEFIAETIVTSDLLESIASDYGTNTYFCLTGFKWIAEIIRNKEGKEKFLGGGEESFGFMIGDFVRDKDSITSGLICCEIAAFAKAQGKSMYQLLIDIYVNHGFYLESLISIQKTGLKGSEEIKAMMAKMRSDTPSEIAGKKVVSIRDYSSSIEKDLVKGSSTKLAFPSSNVIQLFLEDGSKITARPSGTEPKIKFYFSVNSTLPIPSQFVTELSNLKEKIVELENAIHSIAISE
jgi:phosphoglucomutase